MTDVRANLDHPVIDSDGHLIECFPVVRDFLAEDAGESVAAIFDHMVESRPRPGIPQNAWWGVPARNTLDRATAMLPQLLYNRLDQLGIDVAVLYPTGGLTVLAFPIDEVRQAIARAFNRYYAEAYAEFSDRLIPAAAIPSYSPEEAVAEIEHAASLGLKAVMLAGVIPRPPAAGADDDARARVVDPLGHASSMDYEPLWQALEQHGMAATFHAPGMGWGSRTSMTNYVYNHIGNFAAAGEAAARSLFFGGVPTRHPNLRFAFQEGGVATACQLFADTLGHYEKRNRDAIRHYDPAELDRGLLEQLVKEHATGPWLRALDRIDYGLRFLSVARDEPADEFAESGVDSADAIVDIFTKQYFFGCEADDPMNAIAFNRAVNPHGAQLRAVFASDIGHWDVPDFNEVLPEAWELVEKGLLTEEDFAEFTFGNAVDLWCGNNPGFFDGTVVADQAKARLNA